MSDTTALGKIPLLQTGSMIGSSYLASGMLAAALSAAVFCAVWILTSDKYALIPGTPLYAIPLAVGLFRWGRIRTVGVLMLLAGITGAHYLAVVTAVSIFQPPPFFSDTAKHAAEAAAIARVSGYEAGAGAVGAALTFAFIASLAPRLRDRQRLLEYGFATLILALLGSVSLGGLLPKSGASNLTVLWLLYVPWQLIFGFAIIHAFKDHQALPRKT